MRLNWYGTFSGGQGYSGSSEQLALAIERAGVDTSVASFTRVPKENISRAGHQLKKKPFRLADIGVCYGFPNSFSSMMNKHRVGYTMFETDKLPVGHSDWTGRYDTPAEAINSNVDLLLVPCSHNVQVFRDSGVRKPIEIVPNGVSPQQFSLMERPKRKQFTFLMMATLTIRKNPGAVISAFSSLFGDNPDVRLVLKTQSGTLGHMQFHEDMGNIVVIDQSYKHEDMLKLFEEADCFVFPSRGEGFGLPPLEAMATGLPTIIADNTGMSDYADERYNYVVRQHTEQPAVRYPIAWGDVGNWYEPDYQEFKALMKHVYDNQDEAREKGRLASEWVRTEWSYDRAAEKLLSALQKHFPDAYST